ncbi:malonate transporter [Gallibacterium genomosp. 3]|uniref:Malonate transporter n=2 Tax=Gallibacterium TaxID=155493 RepID=A0A1A7NV29_9PAST|nr:AEC family transporter [Gallibacterium genomosp. 3]OBW93435.1 malonate transporter [Gallibacterium genomosp. 3]
MDGFLSSISFSVSVTLPNILMLFLGIYLRRIGMINDQFCQQGSKLVFNITLPALLFLSIVQHPTDYGAQLQIIVAGYVGCLITFLLAELFAARYVADIRERGTFVQGVFRGNTGIIGLSLCANAYGTEGIASASVYTALITILYNILAVITLSRSLSTTGKPSVLHIAKQIAKNPLILSIVVALIISKFGFSIPKSLMSTGDYLSRMTLPLALLCTGASLDFKGLDPSSKLAFQSSIGRILIAPFILVIVARLFGLTGIGLGVIFLMSATPVAAASYPMVRSMGGNAKTAANIIGITTLGSIISSAIGIVILKQLNWM